MEHLEFVKGYLEKGLSKPGLDYALLRKVRKEIEEQENEIEEPEEALIESIDSSKKIEPEEQEKRVPERKNREVEGKRVVERKGRGSELLSAEAPKFSAQPLPNLMVKNLCAILFPPEEEEEEKPVKNDLFCEGRMAYVVDFENEESFGGDVPSTLVRYLADYQVMQQSKLDTEKALNDKIIDILGALRNPVEHPKKKRSARVEKTECDLKPIKVEVSNDKIFDDVDDHYVPTSSKKEKASEKASKSESKEKVSYFESKVKEGKKAKERSSRTKESGRSEEHRRKRSRDRRNAIVEDTKQEDKAKEMRIKKRRLEQEDDAYAELFPMNISLLEAAGSDDETDFSKMDMGNSKGAVKRCDFDDDKSFEQYQESREAVPKAAFQYGLKTNQGRKTRKNAVEGKKLDKEMKQINRILDERKGNASVGGKTR